MNYQPKTESREGIEYVIYSAKRKSIWAGGPRVTYLTEMQAESELRRQLELFSATGKDASKLDWKVEPRHWHCQIYVKDQDEAKSSDFDF